MNASAAQAAVQAYSYPLLIKQLWHSPLAICPDQEIVYRNLLRLSYREVHQRVGRLAQVLEGLGLVPGETVAVMDWDSHRYLECFHGVPMMGAVLMTANIRLSPDQLLYTLNHCGAAALLVHADFLPLLEEIRPKLETVRYFIWLSDDGCAPPASVPFAGEYESLLAQASPDYRFPEFDENTRATTFYTTGTTGLPKGVFFSHRQLVLHTIAGMAAIASPASGQRFHRGDVYMPITPMFHVHAWGMPFIALQLGVKHVYPGRYLADELLETIQREGVTFSHCVPTLLQMILSSPRSKQVDLSRWKVIIGGSALSDGLVQAARERGVDVFAGYGMSETCPLLSIAQLHPSLGVLNELQERQFRCRAGAPVPLVELRAVDENLRDVAADGKATGEVVVRAPWLTQGYLGRPEASEELWESGYLHTQDIGLLDRGYLKITDRLKDVIKTGGEWVSSLEVESLISRHPAVAECAVVGIKDEKWGERPLALIVVRPGQKTCDEEIKKHLLEFAEQGLISRFAVPSRVLLVESIAKTSVGKLNKKLLREQFGPK